MEKRKGGDGGAVIRVQSAGEKHRRNFRGLGETYIDVEEEEEEGRVFF